MRKTVVAVLKKSAGLYISGEELSNRLAVSRTAIWKHIGALREEGYEIESSPRLGYRLVAVPDLLLPMEIGADLKSQLLGKKIYHQREVDSTNRVARELAAAGEAEGAVVLAESQTAGRGRLGRAWSSPAGGVWMSLLLRPNLVPYKAQLITLMAAVAAVEATQAVAGIQLGIKWPNDLMSNGKKVAGILTELSAEMERVNYLVLGLGINVNIAAEDFPADVRGVATSLLAETGSAISRVTWVREFLEIMDREYSRSQGEGFEDVLARWRQYSVTLGCQVEVRLGDRIIFGTALNIDEEGALLVKTELGTEKFLAGEVTLRPHHKE